MNTGAERAAETSCSDDLSSQSVNSATSSQEDLEWDNYSPPLSSCTDECSCTPSSSPCISCRTLTSCHSCIGGPCPSLCSWPEQEESRVPCSTDMPRTPPFAWPPPTIRGGVVLRGDETDSQSTTGDDLLSMESPSCSRTSRLVSSTQDGVLDASIVLSGKPSSASIDFRRKCTAYWDGVRSLHSIASSTESTTTEAAAADTCTSVYSLLSLSNSDSSQPSTLRIFQSFSAPCGKVRVERISLASRTVRPHSADDIGRFRISSDLREKCSRDDEPTRGHLTKRVYSAVQFSQIVTAQCYDGEYAFHSAVEECDAIIQSGNEDQKEEERKHQNSDTNREGDSCNHVHHSKQQKDHSQNTKHQRDRDQQPEDHADHCRDQNNHRRRSTDHKEDNAHLKDQIDCLQGRRDRSDQLRDHNDTRQHPWSTDHQHRAAKLPDHCYDPKDHNEHGNHKRGRNEHGNHKRGHNEHGNHKRDHNEHGNHKRDHNAHGTHKRDHNEHGTHKRDHNEHGNRKKDHTEDHHGHRHHVRQHKDSKRYHGKRHPFTNKTDLRDPGDHRHHNTDNSDCCDDPKEQHIDFGNHGHRSKGRFRESVGQLDDFKQKRDNSACCSDSGDSFGHERHGRDLKNTNQKSKDQDIRPHRERDHGDSHNDSRDKSHTDNGHRLEKVNIDCAPHIRNSDSQECRKVNSSDDVHMDSSCETYKVSESCSRGFSSDTESDLEDYIKELKCRQSRYLDDERFYLGFMSYEKAPEREEEKKEDKNENRENEEAVEKLEATCDADNAFSIGNIPDLRNSNASEGTQPVCQTEDRQIDVDLRCCEYPETIPPLEYFQGRAKLSIEGDLDERPKNESPLLYEPRPLPLRSCTPQPPRETYFVEPVHELHSNASFEPHLAYPPLSRWPLSRVTAQGAPCILTAQPAVCMPEKMPRTPVVAYKTTADGDRRPTSIRDKAENMPIVRRFIPMQIGDITDVYQIEAFSNRRSWGLKPELVRDELATAASITKRSFVDRERRIPSKSVGWAKQLTPIPSIHSDNALAVCVDNDSFDSMTSYSTQDRNPLATDPPPRSIAQSMNSLAENRISSYPPGCTPGCPSAAASSTRRSILVGSRVSDESRLSSTIGGSRVASIPEDSRAVSSMPGGGRLSSSIPGGSRLPPSVPNDGCLTSSDRSNSSYACPAISETYIGPDDAKYSIVHDFEDKRHTFGYSDRQVTVRLTRHTTTNRYGLTIGSFNSQTEVLVAGPHFAQADIYSVDPSFNGVEVIPAIEDLIVQIPSQTEPPKKTKTCQKTKTTKPSETAKPPCDDSDVTCLKELLAVPLRGQDDSDSERSADSDGQLCKASRSRCLDTSASGVPFCQPQRLSSKQPLPNLYPSENCLCTSVTQVISRSMKHGTDGDCDGCAVMRDKCSSSNRRKWYRSLSSKTIHDIQSEDSITDGNSSTSEMKSEECQLHRTSTWVDCCTLQGSELRRQTQADEYGEEMQEASSCTDSVTTIYTRLPTSSARHRTVNCCALATESCDENCFTRATKRYSKEVERKPDGRKCRRSSPEAVILSCGHRCRLAADDRIIASTVVASLGHHRCNALNGGGRSREQTFERKYKALKQYCIETLGCVPPPPTPLRFE